MQTTTQTAKEIFHDVMANPTRKKFGFGRKLAVVNIDVQKAYTSGEFATSYMTDLRQVEYINEVSHAARSKGLPVIWTHVAYMESAADAGVWGTRTNTPDSLQNIKIGSRRGEFDDRVEIHEDDAIYLKKMPSCFHETTLQSLLVWHQVDTIVLTGGSTSGCVRASAVESFVLTTPNVTAPIAPFTAILSVHVNTNAPVAISPVALTRSMLVLVAAVVNAVVAVPAAVAVHVVDAAELQIA